MREDPNTLDNLRCAVLHQTIVSRDVWLTLGRVDD